MQHIPAASAYFGSVLHRPLALRTGCWWFFRAIETTQAVVDRAKIVPAVVIAGSIAMIHKRWRPRTGHVEVGKSSRLVPLAAKLNATVATIVDAAGALAGMPTVTPREHPGVGVINEPLLQVTVQGLQVFSVGQ